MKILQFFFSSSNSLNLIWKAYLFSKSFLITVYGGGAEAGVGVVFVFYLLTGRLWSDLDTQIFFFAFR